MVSREDKQFNAEVAEIAEEGKNSEGSEEYQRNAEEEGVGNRDEPRSNAEVSERKGKTPGELEGLEVSEGTRSKEGTRRNQMNAEMKQSELERIREQMTQSPGLCFVILEAFDFKLLSSPLECFSSSAS